MIGVGDLLGVGDTDPRGFRDSLAIGCITLTTMVSLSVWGRGVIRLICSMLGIATGLIASFALGLVSPAALRAFAAVPEPHSLAYDFHYRMIPAFLLAGSAAMLRTVGVVTSCQKSMTPTGSGPTWRPFAAGILADGLGCLIGGPLGGHRHEYRAEPRRRIESHRATSRHIAFSWAAVLVVFALCRNTGRV